VSVSTYVPATKPTPSTMASAISTSFNLFARRFFQAMRNI
jgi:hypothetical protein